MAKKTMIFGIYMAFLCLPVVAQRASKEILYVGTFSDRDSKGIYVVEFNRATGKLTELQTFPDKNSPSFLEVHPNGKFLYAVYREGINKESKFGTVAAFKVDQATGKISKINEQSSEGAGPCHVSVDPGGKFAFVSNYSGGNISVFPIQSDGSLGKASSVVQHKGSSVNPNRQKQPHMHSVVPSRKGGYIYASDLGIDKVMIYKVNKSGELSPAKIPFVKNTPGSGPRHFTFDPKGNFAFSLEELTSTIASFKVDKASGGLIPLERVNALPEGSNISNTGADIHVSPDGKFLYASNRGHDSLVIFAIAKNGKLTYVGHESTRGGHPRNFWIDKKGEYVFVVNRDNDNLVVFKRDQSSGKLSYTGEEARIPAAVCVKQLFLP
jgi:6-phosphogluconolactonase